MGKEKYPLQDVLKIKKRKFEQAVKVFEEKTQKLLDEEEKLYQAEEDKNKVLEHKVAKLNQIRQALDKGEKYKKIEMMKNYLDIVKEQLKEKECNVETQKKEVAKAEKELEEAKKNLFEKKKDLEKLNIHKDEWKKETALEEKREEAVREDEMGSVRHAMKQKKHKKG